MTVLAAASLTESFDQLKKDFEAANPGVTVETSYGSSATLVQQVDNGAPASVIALAGTAAAEPLDKAVVKDTKTFATNVLEIAVPPSNPGAVTSINDLAKPSVKVVLCADTVPCGKAAQATFKKARIVPNVVSKEVDVKATLSKVKLAEADAAVVYHSDVVAAKDAVTGVEIPSQLNTSLVLPRHHALRRRGDQGLRRLPAERQGPGDRAVVRLRRALSGGPSGHRQDDLT